jgi:RNA polymerase sigma-70 factor (ECF subfamily)
MATKIDRTADDFAFLLEPHYNSALQYCRALFQNKRDAEDGLQDAIITAIQKFSGLRDSTKFKSWFFTIITRTFYAAKKRQLKTVTLFKNLKQSVTEFPDVYEEDSFTGKESLLMAALNTLTEKERSAILLFELGQFSIAEIMQIQGEISLSAIKSRLSRTREKLRNTIILLEGAHQKKGDNYDLKNSISGSG